MPNPESKNITQLYFFLTTDCKIKFSLGTQKRSQEGPDVMDIYLGIWQPKGCAAQFPLWGKTCRWWSPAAVPSGPPTVSCWGPTLSSLLQPTTEHSRGPQSQAIAAQWETAYRQSLLLGFASAWQRPSQPERLSASASFFPSLMSYELPCSFTLVS